MFSEERIARFHKKSTSKKKIKEKKKLEFKKEYKNIFFKKKNE